MRFIRSRRPPAAKTGYSTFNHVMVIFVGRVNVSALRQKPVEQVLVGQAGDLEQHRGSQPGLGVQVSASGMQPGNARGVILNGQEVKRRFPDAVDQMQQFRPAPQHVVRPREIPRANRIPEFKPRRVGVTHRLTAKAVRVEQKVRSDLAIHNPRHPPIVGKR